MSVEIIGWVADVSFLLAYFLVSRKKITGDSKLFNSMNLFGALLYGFYGWKKNAVPVIILEMFWGGIALYALYSALRTRAAKKVEI